MSAITSVPSSVRSNGHSQYYLERKIGDRGNHSDWVQALLSKLVEEADKYVREVFNFRIESKTTRLLTGYVGLEVWLINEDGEKEEPVTLFAHGLFKDSSMIRAFTKEGEEFVISNKPQLLAGLLTSFPPKE